MSTQVKTQSEIPDAPFYVIATDTFMSGWGQAEGKDNVVILPCVDEAEAERVAAYADSRPEQENVAITTNKTEIDRETTVYSLMTHTDAARWYRGL